MKTKLPLIVLHALGGATLGWLGHTPLALADYVTITSVNGNAQASVVDVRPGDVVYLSAQSQAGASLIWSANDIPTGRDECVAVPNASDADGVSCLGDGHFDANPTGVAFYVPYDAPAEITVSVHSSTDGSAIDSVILKNSIGSVDPTYSPPTQIVSDPQNYTANSFSADTALAGHGRWVTISNERHFVPYQYRDNWVPYQNGNWVWANNEYTWVSLDPWGWMTDHYGTWRHHGTYGWTWVPFRDMKYRAHTVTFFHHNDGYVGWYPYYSGASYALGAAAGFDDYYWSGYQAHGAYRYGGGYVPGFTIVRSNSFLASNCFDARVELSFGFGLWSTSHSRGWYGRYPGAGDVYSSRSWIEASCGRSFPVTTVYSRSYAGGFVFQYPVAVHAVPSSYRTLPYANSLRRPIPVGTVYAGGTPSYRRIPSPGYQPGQGAIFHPAPPARPYQPTPSYRQPTPSYRQPTPSYRQPTPAAPAPSYRQPTPSYRQPTPAAPAPGNRLPTPSVRTPAPAAPGVRLPSPGGRPSVGPRGGARPRSI